MYVTQAYDNQTKEWVSRRQGKLDASKQLNKQGGKTKQKKTNKLITIYPQETNLHHYLPTWSISIL